MLNHHGVARTTHTLELDQVDQVNRRLAGLRDPRPVAARALGVDDLPAVAFPGFYPGSDHKVALWLDFDPLAPKPLAPNLILECVSLEGSPSYPYIWGRFRSPAISADLASGPRFRVILEAGVLHRLSLRLGLPEHRWELPPVDTSPSAIAALLAPRRPFRDRRPQDA